jgi:DNA-directed RNA polymerase specialized sigma subunit
MAAIGTDFNDFFKIPGGPFDPPPPAPKPPEPVRTAPKEVPAWRAPYRRQAPAIEPGSLEEAYQAWQSEPSPKAMAGLLRRAEPVLQKGITSFSADRSPTVKARAKLLAVDAVRRFDPKGKAKLETWLLGNLKGLTRYNQQLSPIRLPERMDYESARLLTASTELSDRLGRPPTDEELSEETGIAVQRMQRIRNAKKPVMAESQLKDEEGSPYLPGVARQSPEAVWAEYVYHDLTPMDKKIYDHMTGRGGHEVKGVSEIARMFRVTPGAISQRAAKIAQKLNAYETQGGV